jgi:hypothetical protein
MAISEEKPNHESMSNGEFVMHAVVSHHDLVGALQAMSDAGLLKARRWSGPKGPEKIRAIKLASAALAREPKA